jgi:transposase
VELLEKTDGMSIYEAARTVGVAYASVYKAVAKKRAAGLYKVCPCCKKSEIPERTPEDEYENF